MTDVSVELGKYMLRGWVLTNTSCSRPNCNIPLMRSPNGITPVTHLCASCDAASNDISATGNPSEPPVLSSPSLSSASHMSRSSTPATQLSDTAGSPDFIPTETEESARRRHQSDTASQEIGKRLLKGWAMLADECPNTRCYGVPLVRPPKAGGGKDTRMECVICGTVYEAGVDNATSRDGGRGFTHEKSSERIEDSLPSGIAKSAPSKVLSASPFSGSENPPATSLAPSTFACTVASLEMALNALSERLQTLSKQPLLDPASISVTADAICKVTQALVQTQRCHQMPTLDPVP